jgi:hypothetical protein
LIDENIVLSIVHVKGIDEDYHAGYLYKDSPINAGSHVFCQLGEMVLVCYYPGIPFFFSFG